MDSGERQLTVHNIINNRVVEARELRKVGDDWEIPTTTEQDIAFALKCVRQQRHVPLNERVRVLAAIGAEGTWIGEDHLRILATKTGSPIRFLRFVIQRMNRWLSGVEQYVASQGTGSLGGELSRGGVLFRGSVPTTVILAGDSIALAAWCLGQSVLANAKVVAKPSSAEPLSTFLFAKALLDKGIDCPNLLYLDGSADADRQKARSLLVHTDQSVVYGEDATVAAVYGNLPYNPAHKAIPYWSGRSAAIVFSDADVELAARCIIEGATEDRGNRCVSTKKVFAPIELRERLEAALVAAADALVRGDVLDERTDLGRTAPEARAMAERAAAQGEIFYSEDLFLARCADADASMLRDEIPCPIVAVRYGQTNDELVSLANQAVRSSPSGRALVTAVFSTDRNRVDRATPALHAYKTVWNQPTTYFDLNVMHQGMHLFMELMRPAACPL